MGGTTFDNTDGADAYAILPFTKGAAGLTASGPQPAWLYTNYSYDAQAAACPDGALTAKPHAVTAVGGDTYCYDKNGNMVKRVEGAVTYEQVLDAENRLTSVTNKTANPNQTTTFVYDGDGSMVKKTRPDGTYTVYIGGVYEVEFSAASVATKKTSIYGASGAMRVDVVGGTNTLYYMLADHLGSASALLKSDGTIETNGEQRYYPFGDSRLTNADLKTQYLYTGQLALDGLGGLYHYGARAYLPRLGRFISADTIVQSPGDPQTMNRYAYVRNNPVMAIDPTGHIYDTWANCNQFASGSNNAYANPNGGVFSGADCWKYNQEKNILENSGVKWDVLNEQSQDTQGLLSALSKAFGLSFTGNYSWSDARAITQALAETARALGKAMGTDAWMESNGASVFKAVFGGYEIVRSASSWMGNCGYTGISQIYLYDCWSASKDPNTVIHELGHAFDFRVMGYWHISDAMLELNGLPQDIIDNTDPSDLDSGYSQAFGYGPFYPGSAIGVERFADMFLAFVVGGYNLNTQQGVARNNFMQTHMPTWIGKFYP